MHSIIETPPEASLVLQFSSEILSQLKDIDSLSHRLKNFHHLREKDGEIYTKIFEGIHECYELYHSDELFVETRIKMKIIEMLYNIAMHIVQQNDHVVPCNTKDGCYRVHEACEYIVENCTRNITQKEVAARVNFSTYYFSRIFKEYTMESFNDFLSRQRLEHAVRLLTTDNTSITEIAFLSGFQSISNFNKTFLKAMGCSPKQYRKMWHENKNSK